VYAEKKQVVKAMTEERVRGLQAARIVGTMMKPLRQKRVTDRGKYEAGSLPDITQLPISSGRGVGGAIDGEDDGGAHTKVKRQPRIPSLKSAVKKSFGNGLQRREYERKRRTFYCRRWDIVALKSSKGSDEPFWVAQLKEDVIEEEWMPVPFKKSLASGARRSEKGDAVVTHTPSRPQVRHFTRLADLGENGGYVYQFETAAAVPYESILGHVTMFFDPEYEREGGGGAGGNTLKRRNRKVNVQEKETQGQQKMLHRFSIKEEEYLRLRDDVCGTSDLQAARAALALKPLDSESSSSEDEQSSDGEDEKRQITGSLTDTKAEYLATTSTATSSHGRPRRSHDYRDLGDTTRQERAVASKQAERKALRAAKEAERDTACFSCNSRVSAEEGSMVMVLCDGAGCTRGYHLACLQPSRADVPEGDWYCPQCSNAAMLRREGSSV
jgi:hypothetical protein